MTQEIDRNTIVDRKARMLSLALRHAGKLGALHSEIRYFINPKTL